MNRAGCPFQANLFNLIRIKISFVFHAEPTNLLRQLALQGLQHIVVCIENRNAVLFQMCKHFAFRLQNPFSAAQKFNMRHADIRNHTDVRAHCLRNSVQLPEVVHAHFDDCRLMVLLNAENRQRHANLIVVIALCPQGIVFLRNHGCNHILCCCLADTPCHRNNGNIKQISVISRQIKQRLPRIGNQKHNRPIRGCHHLLRKAGSHAVCKALGQKIMPVTHLAHSCNKKNAFLCFSGILCHIPDFLIQRFLHISQSNHLCACCFNNFSDRNLFHKQSSPNALRTSSMSSK